MCFVVSDNPTWTQQRVAPRDIVVLKYGITVNESTFKSPVMGNVYEVGKTLPYIPLNPFQVNGKWYVETGYHSRDISAPMIHSMDYHIMIIPSGSKYLFNPKTQEYVSSNIMYLGRYEEGLFNRLTSDNKSIWEKIIEAVKELFT
jgi:hypothetical protein